MYIYKINLVVDDSIDNLETQNKIDSMLSDGLKKVNIDAQIVSYEFLELDVKENWGKCSVCGELASDWGKDDAIKELSNGAIVDEKWYCDICLPEDHPNHF